MERGIFIYTTLSLFVLGLSHIVQPRAWAEFFISLRSKGTTGVFITAFLHFPIGALIVAFHPVWSGLPMIVTILGWCWLVKGSLYFIFPRIGLSGLGRISLERAYVFKIPGVLFVALSLVLAYSLIR